MPKRTSIYVEGFSHKNPIPAACRVGNMLYSGSVQGTDPKTGRYGATLEEQSALMFAHVRRIVEAAGGSPENIVKMTLWLKDRGNREPVNREWLKMFPDPQSRPARHAIQSALDGEKLLECDFIAVLD
ncbi:MAG: RidA family protein [Betaproteobacteria bacterium]|nr:RidA family protein [Betaproteobacteria bacterium]